MTAKQFSDGAGEYAPLSAGVSNKWTSEQMHYVLANHTREYVEDMAIAVGKTTKAVKNKAYNMGCSIQSKPTGDK